MDWMKINDDVIKDALNSNIYNETQLCNTMSIKEKLTDSKVNDNRIKNKLNNGVYCALLVNLEVEKEEKLISPSSVKRSMEC